MTSKLVGAIVAIAAVIAVAFSVHTPTFSIAGHRGSLIKLFHSSAHAQSTPPQFTVASVKPDGSFNPYHANMVLPEPGRLTLSGLPLMYCIQFAYNVDSTRILGGPNWINSQAFTIIGEAPPAATVAQLRLMLQSLLESRFHLQLQPESKTVLGFVLTVAPGGLKVKQSTPKPHQSGTSYETLPQFAVLIGHRLRAQVVDHTGLTGGYNFTVQMMIPRNPDGSPTMTVPQLVRERLGLLLTPAKVTVQFLQITHLEKPTPN
ncbi:MAG: TIGR03435 family protein [Terriglobales bacterium]